MNVLITTQSFELVFNPSVISVIPSYRIGSKSVESPAEYLKPTGYFIVAVAGSGRVNLTKEFNPRCEAFADRIVLEIRENILTAEGRVADIDISTLIKGLYGKKAKDLFQEEP